jgi:hypothetical protein
MIEAEQARRAAKAQNEARYQQALDLVRGLRGRTMGALKGYGAQRYADLAADYRNTLAGIGQNLVTRGLSNTTAGRGMRDLAGRQYQQAVNRLGESITGMQIGYDRDLTLAEAGIIERREDEYPSYADLVTLMQGRGRYGGAGTAGGQTYMDPYSRMFLRDIGRSNRRIESQNPPRSTRNPRVPAPSNGFYWGDPNWR